MIEHTKNFLSNKLMRVTINKLAFRTLALCWSETTKRQFRNLFWVVILKLSISCLKQNFSVSLQSPPSRRHSFFRMQCLLTRAQIIIPDSAAMIRVSNSTGQPWNTASMTALAAFVESSFFTINTTPGDSTTG